MAGFAPDPYYDLDLFDDERYGDEEVALNEPELEMDPETAEDLDEEIFEREEAARQLRMAQGIEHACAACGCSESRACDGGCVWATASLCSRCAR